MHERQQQGSEWGWNGCGGIGSETCNRVGFGRACFKYLQKPGEFQCLLQLRTEISEHELSAFSFCLSMYFDECAEPSTVNVVDLLKTNDNFCGT